MRIPYLVEAWLIDRLELQPRIDFLRRKHIPQRGHSFWCLFGGLTLCFFIFQVVSVTLLLFYDLGRNDIPDLGIRVTIVLVSLFVLAVWQGHSFT